MLRNLSIARTHALRLRPAGAADRNRGNSGSGTVKACRALPNTPVRSAVGAFGGMNGEGLDIGQNESVREPFAWILRRRLTCAIRRHPSEVRLTRYVDSSTSPLGTVSRCLCGRNSNLTPL